MENNLPQDIQNIVYDYLLNNCDNCQVSFIFLIDYKEYKLCNRCYLNKCYHCNDTLLYFTDWRYAEINQQIHKLCNYCCKNIFYFYD